MESLGKSPAFHSPLLVITYIDALRLCFKASNKSKSAIARSGE
jgi:hypothetical protein